MKPSPNPIRKKGQAWFIMKKVLFVFLLAGLFATSCGKEEIRAAFSPTNAQANIPVQFQPNKPGDSFQWDFGDNYAIDNNTSTEKNPTHTYHFEGWYTVTLRVNNHSTFTEYAEKVYITK